MKLEITFFISCIILEILKLLLLTSFSPSNNVCAMDYCSYNTSSALYYKLCNDTTGGYLMNVELARVNSGWYPAENNTVNVGEIVVTNVNGPGELIHCTSASLRNMNCESIVYNNINNTVLRFNGSSHFCLLWPCVANSDCFCTKANQTTTRYLKTELGWERVLFTDLISVYGFPEVPASYDILVNPFRGRSVITETLENDPQIFHSFDQNTHTYTFHFPDKLDNNSQTYDYQIEIIKGRLITKINANENVVSVVLHKDYFLISGQATSIVYREGEIVASFEDWIYYEKKCEYIGCKFCFAALYRLHCLSGLDLAETVLFIIMIIVVGISILACCGYAIGVMIVKWTTNKMIKLVAIILMMPFRFVHMLVCRIRGKPYPLMDLFIAPVTSYDMANLNPQNYSNSVEMKDSSNVSVKVVNNITDGDKSKPSSNKKVPAKKLWFIFLLFAISLNFKPSFACDSGVTIPITLQDCVKLNSTFERCTSNTEVTAILPFVGAKNCFVLQDDKQKFVGEISYESFRETIPLATDYYTSGFRVLQHSVQHCNDGSSCTSSPCSCDRCAKVNTVGDRTAYGVFSSNELVYNPGVPSCRYFTEPFVFDNILSCNWQRTHCVFSQYALLPNTVVGRVATPITHNFIPTLRFKISNGNSTADNVIIIDSTNYKKTLNNFTVSILGTLNTAPTVFQYPKVLIIDEKEVRLVNAAPAGTPTKNSIGDIQSANSLNLKGTQTSFNYDPSIVQKTTSDLADYYAAVPSAFNTYTKYPALPGIFQGNIWKTNIISGSSSIYSDRTDGPSIIAQITFPKNMYFYKQTTNVCPIGSLKDVSGCYDCELGCSMTIKLKSSCIEGAVTLYIDNKDINLHTRHLTITTEETQYSVNFATTIESNQFVLVIQGTKNSFQIPVKFEATSYVPEITDNTQYVNYEHMQFDTPSDEAEDNEKQAKTLWQDAEDFITETIPGFFKDLFTGGLSWYYYLIIAVVAVVVFVLLIKILSIVKASIARKTV